MINAIVRKIPPRSHLDSTTSGKSELAYVIIPSLEYLTPIGVERSTIQKCSPSFQTTNLLCCVNVSPPRTTFPAAHSVDRINIAMD
jgi:hypothetical protein